MNQFLREVNKKDTVTLNGAVSNSTSGDFVLDYFGKCGSYRGRSEAEVNSDMAKAFGENPSLALKVVFYNRMVTRKVKGLSETETVQRGQGQKDEFVKSLKWLENNYPDLLHDNLGFVPAVGCWKDLWYDSAKTGFYHYVAPEKVYSLIQSRLHDKHDRQLLAKYLPKIRSKSATKTARHERINNWARGLCRYLGWSERDYRKFKSNPEHVAHKYQRLMCDNKWDQLNFNAIPGKALFNLVSRKGKDYKTALERHNLEQKYLEWIKTQHVAKFTGYPYELYRAAAGQRNLVQKHTYDKQFEQLLAVAKENVNPELLKKGVLCALDTSGSMTSPIDYQSGISALDVCVSLGIYFSSLLEGHFKDHVVAFSDTSKFYKLKGTFCDRVDQIRSEGWWMGSTNFQSVIDEIVRVRKQNPRIPVEDYPQVLLVVSDMQFNPVSRSMWDTPKYGDREVQTNYEAAMRKLRAVGLPEMTIIWWHVNGRNTNDFPSTIDDVGTVLISGFDPSIVTTILGGEEEVVDQVTGQKRKLNPYEQMVKALDQEILNRLVG